MVMNCRYENQGKALRAGPFLTKSQISHLSGQLSLLWCCSLTTLAEPCRVIALGILLEIKLHRHQSRDGEAQRGVLFPYDYWLLIRLDSRPFLLPYSELWLKEKIPINAVLLLRYSLNPNVYAYLLFGASLFLGYASTMSCHRADIPVPLILYKIDEMV